MSVDEWVKLARGLETELRDKLPFEPTKFYLVGVCNLNDEPLAEF